MHTKCIAMCCKIWIAPHGHKFVMIRFLKDQKQIILIGWNISCSTPDFFRGIILCWLVVGLYTMNSLWSDLDAISMHNNPLQDFDSIYTTLISWGERERNWNCIGIGDKSQDYTSALLPSLNFLNKGSTMLPCTSLSFGDISTRATFKGALCKQQ